MAASTSASSRTRFPLARKLLIGLVGLAIATFLGVFVSRTRARPAPTEAVGPGTAPQVAIDEPALGMSFGADQSSGQSKHGFSPRQNLDTSGAFLIAQNIDPWKKDASLPEIADAWRNIGSRLSDEITAALKRIPEKDRKQRANLLICRAMLLNSEGRTDDANRSLLQAKQVCEKDPEIASEFLYTVIYQLGITALRQGENENCVRCLGKSACILPIVDSAVHREREGSTRAMKYFREYLAAFPDDLSVKWLLNLAAMTLGEHPNGVEAEYLLSLDFLVKSEMDIGQFRDISDKVGISDRRNQAGGAIMDDFDNDGLPDLVLSSFDNTQSMEFYRNVGDGTFQARGASAGLSRQTGGLNCVQTDYNNDGYLDILVVRGAWQQFPMPPSLLRNNRNGTFTDVSRAAGVGTPVNSPTGQWADYDNDGDLDLFIACEQQANRLYRNRGDGTFAEVLKSSGLVEIEQTHCKGANWLDYDNDDFPDLFLNYLDGTTRLYRNNRDATFTEISRSVGVDGPKAGFSCWAWDYDNDGWLDIFSPSYDRIPADAVNSILGRPHRSQKNRLFHNEKGARFRDVTRATGLDSVFVTMGSNFGDFDNDGWLDFYLATGDPEFGTLFPNRMFKNVDGARFSEITGSSRTGHLQKGHGVACGDWDRDGNVDLFVELGGAVNGDRYHNVLFQNPGHANNWLTVKLVGVKSNRPGIGARLKIVTDGAPSTIHRHISSGSSFGANPLSPTIGVGKATVIKELEVHWPTSRTTQVFKDVSVNQAIEIREFASEFKRLDWRPVRHGSTSLR